jgi:hypothetical protein
MTIWIQIEPETGMAIATCSGILGVGDAQEGAKALWKAPGWLGRSAVWDFREAQFDLSYSDLLTIAQFIFSNQPATPPLKIAFVTQRDVDFGMARMFEAFREDLHTEFRVFRDCEEAIYWARSLEPDTA